MKVSPSLRSAWCQFFSSRSEIEIHHRLVSVYGQNIFSQKKFKIELSAKKKKTTTMATMFCDCEGLLLCEFLSPKTTVINDKFCEIIKKNSMKP
jgi:hypothetical protein